jgi:tRNA 2-thiouridine synthesizing protein A
MKADVSLDCFGLLCPMPVIKTAQLIKGLKIGQVLEIVATDMGIKNDLPAWCRSTGQQFLGVEEKDGEYHAYIKKLVDLS